MKRQIDRNWLKEETDLKKVVKISIVLALSALICLPTVVSASQWYGSQITLPRAGTSLWKTTLRKATSDTQGLKASKNKYEVIGNISNSGNGIIGSWKTFSAENTKAQYTTTYSNGSSIKAVFQTNRYNPFTTSAYLEWRP